MLTLYDADTRELETIRPGHRGELRVLAVAPALADPDDPDVGLAAGLAAAGPAPADGGTRPPGPDRV